MLNQRSFSEVLHEIHSEESISSTVSESAQMINAGWESLQEPSHLAFLMGQLSMHTPTPPLTHKAYPPRKRPSHLFNIEQQSAFITLAKQAPALVDNFNLRELRSAYRFAVLKTHPDQGGTAESFQAVKKSYHILWAFVNTGA
jgi:hypothetical protein